MNDTNHKSAAPRKRGGRKRTGTIRKTRAGLWQAVVTLPGGKQKRLPPGGLPAGTSEAKAREFAAYWSEKVTDLPPEKPAASAKKLDAIQVRRSVDAWTEAWFQDREASGKTSVRENRGHWEHHIAALLGEKHPSDWTKDDLRSLSRALDEKTRAGSIAHKTAGNIWGTATRMCDDAAEHKDSTIRCREDNPALGVRGPDRGGEKSKEFLYPAEFLQFYHSEKVPQIWKRAAALAIYTFMRAGELRVLRWEDVDLQHATIHVHRAYDRTTGQAKSTKANIARTLPIHPAILPLLTEMHREAAGRGLVIELPSETNMSRMMRRYLERAGLSRAALFSLEETRRPIRFHDLRATGLTWLAVQGSKPLEIQELAGHSDFSTTKRYLRIARAVGGPSFGTPFPFLELTDAQKDESLHSDAAQAFDSSVFCGEGGIRTRGTVARTHDFQSCTFGRSVTSPGFGSRPYLGGARFGLLVHVACQRNKNLGGESGIRTHGRRKPTPDFESGSFGHSDTSPRRKLAASPQAVKTESPRKSSLSGESANSYELS